MIGRIGAASLVLFVAACAAPGRRPPAGPAPPGTVAELAAAIAADAERSDHATDAATRGELAADASRDADACMAREPGAAACLYGHGVAAGLEARVHPTRAGELLTGMLQNLAAADAADPHYDHAGPARVRALVLTRAPGWPLGPGDPEAGLGEARRATALERQYPPNWLALAEALAKSGDAQGARDSFARARDLAQAQPISAERDAWLREADQGLRRP